MDLWLRLLQERIEGEEEGNYDEFLSSSSKNRRSSIANLRRWKHQSVCLERIGGGVREKR